jgi:hypothetical protein
VGIASLPRDGTHAALLLRAADRALADSQRSQRSQQVHMPPVNPLVEEYELASKSRGDGLTSPPRPVQSST